MDTGVALRSEVFGPQLIRALAPRLDQHSFNSVWFPDVAGFDALELAALALGATARIRAATGVVRFYEQDPNHFAKRVRTLQAASGSRLIVGVGTGATHGAEAIRGIRQWVETLGRLVGAETEIYVAALRKTMFSVAAKTASGALLNFCSPSHVSKLVSTTQKPKGFRVACYIKLFYAPKDAVAKRMLVDEFVKYDSYPHYHRLFEELGVADTIRLIKGSHELDQELYRRLSAIALYNPPDEEVRLLVEQFRRAGVDLPIVYPYVEGDSQYKVDVLKRLSDIFV